MKTLIIKIGALGDVLRTTPLLRVLPGEVWWLTAAACFPLVPRSKVARLVAIEDPAALRGEHFDQVLSLDDDREAATIASSVSCRRLIGAYAEKGDVRYTPDTSDWFDLSLVSRFGKERADQMKFENRRSWQDMLFSMIGRCFAGEEYLLEPPPVAAKTFDFGLEGRAGKRWPTKVWHLYPALGAALQESGYRVRFLEQQASLPAYVEHIAACRFLVSGDSLAMHIAMAARVPTVAIFTCTSPTEIYGYDRTIKLVSPQLRTAFYRQEYIPAAVEAIGLDQVLEACRRLVGAGAAGENPAAPAPR